MKYTEALAKLCGVMQEATDIKEIKFSKNRDSFRILFTSRAVDTFYDKEFYAKEFENTEEKGNSNYADYFTAIYEVMKGRPDINNVKFSEDRERFEVISNTSNHICFADEFKKINENKWEEFPIKDTTEDEKKNSAEEKQKLIDYIQLESFRKIRQKANDITDESSIEEFAGYVHGIVDLETELYSYIENNFKN